MNWGDGNASLKLSRVKYKTLLNKKSVLYARICVTDKRNPVFGTSLNHHRHFYRYYNLWHEM